MGDRTQQDGDGTPAGNQQDATGQVLSVAQAAAALGVSAAAVRARLRRGTLHGEKGPGGAWRVPLDDLLDVGVAAGIPVPDRQDPRQEATGNRQDGRQDERQDTTGGRQDVDRAEAHQDLLDALRDEVAFLRDQLDQRSRELAAERERSDVLMREALQRIPALMEPLSAPREAPGAHEGAEPVADTPGLLQRLWRALGGR